ncbi:MAG: primosomal protein N' [Candidatus Omnitrophica bacterium]|nr:primosomal protein N' [Candidatus Omnitrophota bacterium]
MVFNLPIERSFHYLIPPALRAALEPGMRVAAPFGRRECVGIVVARAARSPVKELKAFRRVIDPAPVIAGERWALARWLSSTYYCSLGEALFAMVPADLRLRPLESHVSPETPQTATPPQLSADQTRGLTAITEALEGKPPTTVLLHGVTGSGKTELYLRAIEILLARGQSAICLVPEIALTPQTIERFRGRFGSRVAVWHSGLTARQRAQQWQAMAAGHCPVVVGARSAIFAPVPRLGLIILDEEHETTYKQEDVPRYHAREAARARAQIAGAAVFLGSATPSMESYHAATTGRMRLVELPQRMGGRRLPAVELVDLGGEWAGRSRGGPLSSRLQQLLERTVARGEQAMLLLNRRGFSRTAQCQGCGFVVRCPRCAVPLIYHASRQLLVCHYCNFQQPLAELCPSCRKGYLKLRGAGTERIESELHRLFPSAAIGRMDRDTTRRRGGHQDIYDAFRQRQTGLLVGTQMIAKGLDFPQVTLVGIVSADTSLNLPDFRAGERTFDLLTQMAGRAGRGEQPGTVIVQTYCPDHYAIQAAKTHDYAAFYREELAMRRRLRLPPFARLVELTVHATSRPRVEHIAERLAQALSRAAGRRRLSVVGPAPHRIARLRGSYRMCLLLKGRRVEPMVELLRATLQPGRKFAGLPVTVDVDPL